MDYFIKTISFDPIIYMISANISESDSTFFEFKKGLSNTPTCTISYTPGKLKNSKLSDLIIHPLNKKIYTENNDLINSLAENIKKNKLINPIVINKNNQILSGNLRFKALQKIGVQEIDVYIVDIDEDIELEFIISSNQQRTKSIIDESNEIQHLYDKYSPGQGSRDSSGTNTIQQISILTGYTTSKISSIRKINSINSNLLLEINNGNLTLNGALKQCDKIITIKKIDESTQKDLSKNLTISNIDTKYKQAVINLCKKEHQSYIPMIEKNEITPEEAYSQITNKKEDKIYESEMATGYIETLIICPFCSQPVKRKEDKEWYIKNKLEIDDFLNKRA